MTLGQFATAVGADPRWVQNASRVLGLSRRYSLERARFLFVARRLTEETGMPLTRAWALAPAVSRTWPDAREFISGHGPVRIVVDVERLLAEFAVRASLARSWYGERRRGRPAVGAERGVRYAVGYGVDVSLVESALALTPEERLRRNDEALEAFPAAGRGTG